ncbi:MAG TPA: endonuclease/exonuclease/phosphatase family protein [Pirellulaceae bacterium]|nr:endonuclease/exonuclease/phosphatase family protein [Pirellulaceae bacterium]
MIRSDCILRTAPCALLALLAFVSPASADPLPKSIRVATWNLEWFYDDKQGDNESDLSKELSAPSAADWKWKVDVAAAGIAKLDATIVALQEIENRRVLRDLTKVLEEKHGQTFRIAYIEGWDVFTEQDVAILFRGGLVEMSRREQSKEMFESRDFYNLQKHLFARFEWGAGAEKQTLTMLTVHFRASAEGASIRERQSRLAKAWLQDALARGENVILLGDVNTSEEALPPPQGTDVDILSGRPTPTPKDDLVDLHVHLPANQRQTHLNGDSYDRIFVSPSLIANEPGKKDFVFQSIARVREASVRGTPDTEHRDNYWQIPVAERDVSDHYPLVAEFLVK